MALDNFGSIGVTVIMPYISFTSEVATHDLHQAIRLVDNELDKRGIDETAPARMIEVIENATSIAYAMSEGNIDTDTAVSEIALAFVYAEIKRGSVDDLLSNRGIVCYLLENSVYILPCADDAAFASRTERMFEMFSSVIDKDDPDEIVETRSTWTPPNGRVLH